MVNYKMMNDLFMKKDVLSRSELLETGLTGSDLTRLVKCGNLKKNGRGFYSLNLPDRELVYPLINIIERIKSGESMVMLELLSCADAEYILKTIDDISEIKSLVIDVGDKKRIFLRHVVENKYDNLDEYMERANCLYDFGFYDGYIDTMNAVLANIDIDSDTCFKMSFSYQQLIAEDITNVSKMIDYLSLAVAIKDDGKGKLLLDFMKEKYKYDGVKVSDDFTFANSSKEHGIQYKFNFES